jgi:hypothetical protein
MLVIINENEYEAADELHEPKNAAERNERLAMVLNHIENNPTHWNQRKWHCGTSHCFAGFAQLFARGISLAVEFDRDNAGIKDKDDPIENDYIAAEDDATGWLGLTHRQSAFLYDGDNTLDDLRTQVAIIMESEYVRENVGE